MAPVCYLTSQSVWAQLSQYQPGRDPVRARPGGNNRQGLGQGRRGGGGGGGGGVRDGGGGAEGGGGRGSGGGGGGGGDHQGLDWLRDSVPGEPGVDYPIFSLPVPDNSFR